MSGKRNAVLAGSIGGRCNMRQLGCQLSLQISVGLQHHSVMLGGAHPCKTKPALVQAGCSCLIRSFDICQ